MLLPILSIRPSILKQVGSSLSSTTADSRRAVNGRSPSPAQPDGGSTWTIPALVSRNSAGGAWLPSIAIGKNGQIGVSYYDVRPIQTGASEPGLRANVWLSTFRLDEKGQIQEFQEKPVDGFLWASLPEEGYFHGDYFALVPLDVDFGVVYVRTTKGLEAGGRISSTVRFARLNFVATRHPKP